MLPSNQGALEVKDEEVTSLQSFWLWETQHPGIEGFKVKVNFFWVALGGILKNLGHQEVF